MLRTAGVVHRDLHWGNILISTSIEDAPRFYLIDLHQVRVRTVPHDRAGLSNLALLSAALWGNVPSRAQIHFLKAYCRNLLLTRDSFLQVRDEVQGRRDRLLRRKWETLVARSLRENKYFKKIRCGRYSGLARRDCPEAVRRLMEDPDRLFACPDAQVLKDSRTTSSLILHCSEPGPLFFKRYNRKSAWQVLRHLFKRSRARKVWIAAHAMAARGLPTPRPLLYCEERTFGLVTRSFIVTQAIAPATTLEGFAAGRFTGLDRSEKHALIRALARRLRELHDRGVRHGDLKAKNIILADAGSAPHRRIYFVDLDGVRITTSLSLHDRCRDIARLNRAFPGSGPVSTSHRLLFLKAYLGAVRREELRTAWQGIVRLTGKNGKAGVPART